MNVKFDRNAKIKSVEEFDKNKKVFAVFVFFLNALIMLITGMIVFNKELFIYVSIVEFCKIIFWYINLPIMGIYGLGILYFVIKIFLIVVFRLLCLIPAVNRKINKDNLVVFRKEKNFSEKKVDKRSNWAKIKNFVFDSLKIYPISFLIFSIFAFVFYFLDLSIFLIIGFLIMALISGVMFFIKIKSEMRSENTLRTRIME